jgi:hypothetical protein
MRKLATLFVLMITFSMVFAGAVSAQDVETAVYDENGNLVEVACPGEEVIVQTNASADGEELYNATVILTTDPEEGLVLLPDEAVMIFNGIPYFNDDPIFGGFFQVINDVGVWTIGYMDPNDFAQLYVPAVVNAVGPITVNATFIDSLGPRPIFLDEDSYTFLSVPCPPPVSGETVPMKATGSPLALAALGFLSIIGGAVYGKLR